MSLFKSRFCPTIVLCAVLCVMDATDAPAADFSLSPVAGQNYVQSEGTYPVHLQGITTNGVDTIFWSFTDRLVKTDTAGKIIQSVTVPSHHGDLTFANNKLYVAVNLGPFNELTGAESWVYEYDPNTLKKDAAYQVSEVTYGAGGIAYHNGKFLVVGGLHPSQNANFAYEYDESFHHVATHTLPTNYTDRGIQTVEFANGSWWFGTYHALTSGVNDTRQLFRFNESLTSFQQFSFDASFGIAALPNGQFLVGKGGTVPGGSRTGRVELAIADNLLGLKVIPIPVPEPQMVKLMLIGLFCVADGGLLLNRRKIIQIVAPQRQVLSSPHISTAQPGALAHSRNQMN